MKDKVVKVLLKGGFNEETINKMIAQEFEYVIKTYPEAKPRKVADIISLLWSMS